MRHSVMRIVRRNFFSWLILIACGILHTQERASVKEFEVVSVRQVEQLTPEEQASSPTSHLPQISRGFVRMPNESMWRLLLSAFSLPTPQLVAPSWTISRYFHVEGKMPLDARREDIPEMLRSMLSS